MSDTTPPPPPSENPYGAGANPPPPAPPGPSYPTDPGGQTGYPTGAPAGAQPGSYPAAPPPPPAAAPGTRPGELMDRFLARLIDGVLLFFINVVVMVPIVIGVVGLDAGGVGMFGAPSFAVGAVTAVLTTAIYLGYFGFLESSRGQTIGKMVMKLHVQTVEGGKPTFEQAVKRNIWMGLPLLGIVPIIGGLVSGIGQLVAVIMIAVQISNDTVSRAPWTDKFAGTRVIKQG